VAGAARDLSRRPLAADHHRRRRFNVPPAAIRFKVQRRPGAQARVDLTFVWPRSRHPI
jgi:hypothetical protein